jgi:4-hydroxybenzoate polyprenyltransferase
VEAHRGWLYGEAGILLIVGMLALSALRLDTLLWSVGLGGLGGLHLLSGGAGRPMGALSLGKPFLVAGAWALGATILPLVEAGVSLDATAGGVAGYRFLFILPNVLLSDWGDRTGDRAAGLASWTRWGTGSGLRWGATVMLAGAIGGALGMGVQNAQLLLWGVDAVGPLLMLGAVWGVDPQRSYHRFLLDALVAWPGVTALVAWVMG